MKPQVPRLRKTIRRPIVSQKCRASRREAPETIVAKMREEPSQANIVILRAPKCVAAVSESQGVAQVHSKNEIREMCVEMRDERHKRREIEDEVAPEQKKVFFVSPKVRRR